VISDWEPNLSHLTFHLSPLNPNVSRLTEAGVMNLSHLTSHLLPLTSYPMNPGKREAPGWACATPGDFWFRNRGVLVDPDNWI